MNAIKSTRYMNILTFFSPGITTELMVKFIYLAILNPGNKK
jgi:hypothetical protein